MSKNITNHWGDPQGFGGGASVGGGGGVAGLPQAVAETVNNHLIWFGYIQYLIFFTQ